MILKSCVCGASKKNFKMDIGPFYVGECCTEAGYDDLGRLTADSVEGQAPETSDPSLLDRLFSRADKAPVASVTTTPLETPGLQELVDSAVNPTASPQGEPTALQKFFGLKPSRKKLKNMRVEELVTLASARGIEFKEGTTKPEMIAAILAG